MSRACSVGGNGSSCPLPAVNQCSFRAVAANNKNTHAPTPLVVLAPFFLQVGDRIIDSGEDTSMS